MNDILIIIDAQNDFVDGALGTKEAQDMIPALVSRIKSHKGPIICTRDTHTQSYLSTQEGRHLPVPHCILGTPGHYIHPAIQEALSNRNVIYINKDTFGSFTLIDEASEFLPPTNPPRIIIAGLCTDICVVSNALLLKSAFPDVLICVDPACCAGTSPSAHDAAILVLKSCQIEII